MCATCHTRTSSSFFRKSARPIVLTMRVSSASSVASLKDTSSCLLAVLVPVLELARFGGEPPPPNICVNVLPCMAWDEHARACVCGPESRLAELVVTRQMFLGCGLLNKCSPWAAKHETSAWSCSRGSSEGPVDYGTAVHTTHRTVPKPMPLRPAGTSRTCWRISLSISSCILAADSRRFLAWYSDWFLRC